VRDIAIRRRARAGEIRRDPSERERESETEGGRLHARRFEERGASSEPAMRVPDFEDESRMARHENLRPEATPAWISEPPKSTTILIAQFALRPLTHSEGLRCPPRLMGVKGSPSEEGPPQYGSPAQRSVFAVVADALIGPGTLVAILPGAAVETGQAHVGRLRLDQAEAGVPFFSGGRLPIAGPWRVTNVSSDVRDRCRDRESIRMRSEQLRMKTRRLPVDTNHKEA